MLSSDVAFDSQTFSAWNLIDSAQEILMKLQKRLKQVIKLRNLIKSSHNNNNSHNCFKHSKYSDINVSPYRYSFSKHNLQEHCWWWNFNGNFSNLLILFRQISSAEGGSAAEETPKTWQERTCEVLIPLHMSCSALPASLCSEWDLIKDSCEWQMKILRQQSQQAWAKAQQTSHSDCVII